MTVVFRIVVRAVLSAAGAMSFVFSLAALGEDAVQAQNRALDTPEIKAAIEWGISGKAEPYFLQHADGKPDTAQGNGTNSVVVAAVYTPFLRVAMAAHEAWARGQVLIPANIPGSLTVPVVHVAVRWYGACPLDDAVPQPSVVVVPRGGSPTLSEEGIRPSSVSPGAVLLQEYGAKAPYADVAMVATFPLELLRTDVDFIVSKSRSPKVGEVAACIRRARIPVAEFAAWR